MRVLVVLTLILVHSTLAKETEEIDYVEIANAGLQGITDVALNLVETAVSGVTVKKYPIVRPAQDRAYSYLKATDGDQDAAVKLQASRKNTIGKRSLTLLVGFTPGVGTIAKSASPIWDNVKEAALVAAIYGHDLNDRAVRNKILLTGFGPELGQSFLDDNVVDFRTVDSYKFAKAMGTFYLQKGLKEAAKKGSIFRKFSLGVFGGLTKTSSSSFAKKLFKPGSRTVKRSLYKNADPLAKTSNELLMEKAFENSPQLREMYEQGVERIEMHKQKLNTIRQATTDLVTEHTTALNSKVKEKVGAAKALVASAELHNKVQATKAKLGFAAEPQEELVSKPAEETSKSSLGTWLVVCFFAACIVGGLVAYRTLPAAQRMALTAGFYTSLYAARNAGAAAAAHAQTLAGRFGLSRSNQEPLLSEPQSA